MEIVQNRRARLRQWIDQHCAGSQAQFVAKTGINQGELSGLLRAKSFGEKKARTLEAQAGMPVGWLDQLESEDGAGVSAEERPPFDQNVELAIPGRRIPVIDYVQAGAWREIADPFPPGMAFEYLISFAELSGNAFALRIKGDSMQPDFVEGDVIVVDPAVSPRPGSFVVAKNGGEEATFKKYRSRGVDPATGDDIFELVPLNDDYPTLRSDECRCVIIGTAVEVRKRLR